MTIKEYKEKVLKEFDNFWGEYGDKETAKYSKGQALKSLISNSLDGLQKEIVKNLPEAPNQVFKSEFVAGIYEGWNDCLKEVKEILK